MITATILGNILYNTQQKKAMKNNSKNRKKIKLFFKDDPEKSSHVLGLLKKKPGPKIFFQNKAMFDQCSDGRVRKRTGSVTFTWNE